MAGVCATSSERGGRCGSDGATTAGGTTLGALGATRRGLSRHGVVSGAGARGVWRSDWRGCPGKCATLVAPQGGAWVISDVFPGRPTTRTAPCPGYGASNSELSPAWHASWLGRIGNRWTFRLNRRGCISRDARSGVAASDLPGHKARRGSDSRRAALALKPSQPLLCEDLRLHRARRCCRRMSALRGVSSNTRASP